MNRGYVKIWRKLEDSGILGNAEVCQLFMFLMVKACHKSRKIMAGTQIIELQPGEFFTGRKRLASELNSSEQRIRTALSALRRHEVVSVRSTSRGSVISLINWVKYQGEETHGAQGASRVPTGGQPVFNRGSTTKQEVKKISMNQEKKKAGKESAHIGDVGAVHEEMIGAYTQNRNLRQALNEFVIMREAAKKPFTKAALRHTFSELDKLAGTDDAVKTAILNQSVQRGWFGVFPLKGQDCGGTGHAFSRDDVNDRGRPVFYTQKNTMSPYGTFWEGQLKDGYATPEEVAAKGYDIDDAREIYRSGGGHKGGVRPGAACKGADPTAAAGNGRRDFGGAALVQDSSAGA